MILRCILSKFYIKPQHRHDHSQFRSCCILSKFYIKPQQGSFLLRQTRVVSYRNSTSNHNWKSFIVCSLVVVSYRNSTSNHNNPRYLPNRKKLYLIEILHQTTTDKHVGCDHARLYLIEILHQTTTTSIAWLKLELLYLIEILHQTTTRRIKIRGPLRCILSKFYIKPQRSRRAPTRRSVVSYRNSTSNHNASYVFHNA